MGDQPEGGAEPGRKVNVFFQKNASSSLTLSVDSTNFAELDVEKENLKRLCKTTSFPHNGLFKGHPVIVSANWLEIITKMGVTKILSLEPNNQQRKKQIDLIKTTNLQLVSAIHPTALILPYAQIDDGVWINSGCIVGYKAEIRSGVFLNTGVNIDHHNVLQECCQVDPGVVTAGNVVLGECCHIHTGAVLINRIQIGANSIVGAGAVVLKDIQENCTAVGVPAKIIKENNIFNMNYTQPNPTQPNPTQRQCHDITSLYDGKVFSKIICFVGKDIFYSASVITVLLAKQKNVVAIVGETADLVWTEISAGLKNNIIPVIRKRRFWEDSEFNTLYFSNALGVNCGYDYIIPELVLSSLPIINIHPAALPLNRGCHHSFWGIIDKTPFGATLHWMTKELDQGPIISQITFCDDGFISAGEIQEKSNQLCIELLAEHIDSILDGESISKSQSLGTYHSKKEIIAASTLCSNKTVSVDYLFDLCRAVNNKKNGFIIEKDGRKFLIKIEKMVELL
ncbi:hypothetical protein EKD02_09745 [Chlorobium phaeovibrioides]|uniref:Formyl transferase N-terminal domain-containing protein n=1 Tax=Chlorobium phaeovibrioides TaxID=1094 RepID=A0A3S0N904_CHLPH|nr:formyltransferase family protein [Chlorobium phaeovibrioides]RTY34601.1 hypothetical protein EKD02_09745 [Chlorobium phaeovibrioides]